MDFSGTPVLFPFLLLSLLSFSLLFFSLYTRRRRHRLPPPVSDTVNPNDHVDSSNKTLEIKSHDSSPNSDQLNNSLLLEILPALFAGEEGKKGAETAAEDEKKKKKKKKKRGKKKRLEGDELGENEVVMKEGLIRGFGIGKEKENQELVCLYPFTSSSSATQRKIKQQYDQLVKSNESNGLTLLQVGQFVNCLIEARDELKHKSEVIQRKFTITKALLFKADRSSFDRLRQQIYKLELEQKRLEEDAFVYNWLQQQLKLSPAYKKMLEIGACMESKAESGEPAEETDSDMSDISFEELLAQEKKDSFWQKKGKPRSCSCSGSG